ncbi:hypothetical protein AB0M12_15875 [Nocardia vinacea]|uniref:hypothetical protein n=1 Tax=Nocardia TaxID=1817 RepID=UPI00343789A1
MKHTTQALAVTALTAVALAIAGGAAHADSNVQDAAPPSSTDEVSVPVAPGVTFTGSTVDGSSVLVTSAGSVTTRAGQVDVRDADQRHVLGTPIESVAGNVQVAETAAAPVPVGGSGDVVGDLNLAWRAAGPYTGLATSVGATAGALIGAAVGCPLGAVTLGSLATVMSAAVLTVPGMVGGCLAGAATTAAFGSMIGTVAVGLPVGLAVTAQKFNEIQSGHAPAAPRP